MMAANPIADDRASEQSSREDLRLGELRIVELHKTIRRLGYSICAVLALGIVVWGFVRISTDPPTWEKIAAMLVGPTGIVGFWQWFRHRQVKKRLDDFETKLKEVSELRK